jgi:hypothetical protein
VGLRSQFDVKQWLPPRDLLLPEQQISPQLRKRWPNWLHIHEVHTELDVMVHAKCKLRGTQGVVLPGGAGRRGLAFARISCVLISWVPPSSAAPTSALAT